MKLREGEGRQREEFVAFLGPAGTGWGERRPGVACCKVGLDRPLIPTAVVANLFRSARVFRWRAAGRGLGERRSQSTGGSGDHCPNQRKGEFRQPSMPEKQVVSVLAIFYLRSLRRFALTGHWTLTSGH